MADDDDARPSLEPPRLFGRRRTSRTPVADDEPRDEADETFEDAGHDEPTAVLPAVEPEPEPEPEPAAESVVRRAPRDRSRPLLPGRQAAALVGVLAGLSLVGFTWVGFQGCEALRGTSSCGTGPGMAALVVVFVAAVAVGGYLLSFFRVPDPGATSFLAMGLTAVFCLVFLVDHLDHWSMVLVIPAVSAATYLLSWWVTTTYVDTD